MADQEIEKHDTVPVKGKAKVYGRPVDIETRMVPDGDPEEALYQALATADVRGKAGRPLELHRIHDVEVVRVGKQVSKYLQDI